MKSIKIALAGKTYTVNELPRKKNAAWREQFQAEFAEVADALVAMADSDIANADSVAALLRSVMGQVNGAVEKIVALLLAYSSSIAADGERIEEEAYESELLDAFLEVLKLAYPFGSLVGALAPLANLGPAAA